VDVAEAVEVNVRGNVGVLVNVCVGKVVRVADGVAVRAGMLVWVAGWGGLVEVDAGGREVG
jgi:hypothetical protein